ncbi:MAG: transporter substrate-binding domain-containing protein [Lachnospiraceae bacterium]|nr:transporter substrate-binding domain-containing protein [Lachnospiraceae bacterium]
MAGMLALCILVKSTAVGATEDGTKTVSVAYFYDKSYFGNKYDTAKKEGFGYEFLQSLANFAGWKYRYVYGDYNTLLEQFMQGRIDIMPGIPRNFDTERYYEKLIRNAPSPNTRHEIEQNKIDVLFPNQPMNSVDYYFCIPAGGDSENFMLSSYANEKIGIPRAISEYAGDWFAKSGLICELVEYENDAACINALNANDVSAIIAENKVTEAGLTVCRKMGSIDYYIGISSRSRALLKDVNNAFDEISSATDGYLTSLKSTYNSTGELEKSLSSAEKKWLESHDELKVGVLANCEPYSYANPDTGEAAGFVKNAISDILYNVGADLKVSYTMYAKHDELIEALKEGTVDVIFPVPIYLYMSESNDYMNTNGLIQTDMVLVYEGEYSEGTVASIAYRKGGLSYYYDDHIYPNSTLMEYDDAPACLEAVMSGAVGCTILRDYVIEDYINTNSKYRNLHYMVLPEKLDLCLGIKKGNSALYTLFIRGTAIINRGSSFKEDYLKAVSIYKQDDKTGLSRYMSTEVIVLLTLVFLLLLVLVIVSTWTRRIHVASRRLKAANKEIIGIAEHQQQNFDVIGILARDYSSVYKVNLATEEVQTFRMEDTEDGSYGDMLRLGARYSEVFNKYVREKVFEDDKPKMYDEVSIPVIRKKLRSRPSYAIRYRKMMKDNEFRYFEYRVSTADIDETGKVVSAVVAFIDCNDEVLHETEYMKSLEKALKSDAVITGLTGDFDWVAYVANADGKDGVSVTTYRTSEWFRECFGKWDEESDFNHMLELLADKLIHPDDHKMFLRSANKNQVRKHLMKDVAYYINFRVLIDGSIKYYQLKFVADIADGKLFGFILGFHSVDEELRREKEEQEKLENMVEERTAQLEEKNISLNRMNNDIIELMGNIVEGRDAESGQHVRRVKDFTNILATQVMREHPEYNLTKELVDIITSASALHDVGKITISDSILLKPGRLTNEEYEIMKSHTVNGCAILDKMPADWDEQYMKTSMEICRYHHEKYDGKGYPEGLSGDDIPISAQIVSVADCYDALVSKRVYKDAYTCDEAYDMIQRGECGMFNPALMDCLMMCKDQFEKQVNTTNDV